MILKGRGGTALLYGEEGAEGAGILAVLLGVTRQLLPVETNAPGQLIGNLKLH